MKYSIFLILILCLKFNSNVYANDCNTLERKTDLQIKQIFWIDGSNKIPKTEEGMDKFCDDLSSTIKSIILLKKCLAPFPKIIINIMNRQLRKLSKKICESREKKIESLNRLKCLNHSNINNFYNCTHRAFVQLNYISEKFNSRDVIPGFCCLFLSATDCTKKTSNSFLTPCNNSKKVAPLDNLLNGLSDEATQLICSKYKSLTSCEKEFKEGLEKLNEVANSNKIPFKDVDIVKPLLKLADKLSN